MQVDWSRGGDAIVADKSITKIEDLPGEEVTTFSNRFELL